MVQTNTELTIMLIYTVQCLEIFKVSNVTKWLIFQNPVTHKISLQ